MLVRRDELRASKVMQERVKNNPKIEILRNTEAREILGDGQVMTGLRIENNQSNEQHDIQAGGLFYAIGHKPNTEFLGGQVALDETGYIMTHGRLAEEYLHGRTELTTEHVSEIRSGEHFHTSTSVPGVFAAGDVADKFYRQAITSAGTGCMAAIEVEHFLQAAAE